VPSRRPPGGAPVSTSCVGTATISVTIFPTVDSVSLTLARQLPAQVNMGAFLPGNSTE